MRWSGSNYEKCLSLPREGGTRRTGVPAATLNVQVRRLEGKRGEESQVALVARTMLIGAEATVDSCMVADGLVSRSPQGVRM